MNIMKGSTMIFAGAVLITAALNQFLWSFPFAVLSLPAFLWAAFTAAAGSFLTGRGVARLRNARLEAQIRWHADRLHDEIKEHLS